MKPALRVNWTTPQSDTTISQYQVQYRTLNSRTWDEASTMSTVSATSAILTELIAGTKYNVRVRAVSASGEGRWSREEMNRTYRSK